MVQSRHSGHRTLDQLSHRLVRHAHNEIITQVDRDEHTLCQTAPHRHSHSWGNLPQQGVGNHNAHRAHNDIRPAAGGNDRVFAGGGLVGAGLEHNSGGLGVGAHRSNTGGGTRLPQGGDQLAAQAAPLSVHNQNIQRLSLP